MGITEQRQQLILDELLRHGRVDVKATAAILRVSAETIRRDLKDLEGSGHARRVYGGAVVDRKEGDRPFNERTRVNAREKGRIALAARPLVKDGMKIFIDTGTTTLAFARHLLGRRVAIHTNSIDIAALLCTDPEADVVVLGGEMKPTYKALFGHQTLAAISEHFYDMAVVSIGTVHAEHGFMDRGQDEALLRRAALKQSRRSVMLADSSKFGRLGTVRTFALGDIGALVTDGPLSTEFAELFQKTKVDLIHA
ncbi:DeoR/GlpR family DNA-binding transcription regulator [Hansschlegelia plantiphila]|uniref:DeoR family transcriptional regulator n=1 Tax=Hansschlegelia plantiphila TaxID=374655 RepID=A0A9W6IZ07_9HYPH|nr:DeoR/GlpR family DNA-binding transcription regulator [Hansschlegelia plantiphila]GLK67637.1 DeoR family transcriptional regulator [Hansschlegelia plantiphila]